MEQRAIRQVGERIVIREMLEPLFDPPPVAADRGLAQFAIDRRHEPFEVPLHDVVVCAALHRTHRRIFADGARHEDERQVGIARAQQPQRRRAAEARHRVIGDREIECARGEGTLEALWGIDAFEHDVVAATSQRPHHKRGIVLGVFDHYQA